MRSFISSFKPLFAAALTIALIEGGVQLWQQPSTAERSNYLSFNYLSPPSTQEIVIAEKMKTLGHARPDIIQVGDSSGYFGVKPAIVESYLGGLRYANLSCCIPMGYNGYYSVASYMFRHNPGIKAMVLYVSPAYLPQEELYIGDIKTGPVDSAYGTWWSDWMPPSIALRSRVTAAIHSFFGQLRPMQADMYPTDNDRRIAASIRAHQGWVQEEDARQTGAKLAEHWEWVCRTGPLLQEGEKFYHRNWRGERVSQPLETYEKFARLAAKHDAKLILLMQPVGCKTLDPAFLKARQQELAALQQRYPKTVILPSPFFQPDAPSKFSSLAHFRVGEDHVNSHHIGRMLAAALSLPLRPKEAVHNRMQRISVAAPVHWKTSHPTSVEGLTPTARTATITTWSETKTTSPHRLSGTIPDLTPQTPYVFSLLVKPLEQRNIHVTLYDAANTDRQAVARFNPTQMRSERHMEAIDADMQMLENGWVRCWLSMRAPGKRLHYRITLNQGDADSYKGTSQAGILIRHLQLQQGEQLQ